MTNREFYISISEGKLTDEVKEFATAAIEKMDARNAHRASTPNKTQLANAPIKQAILDHLRSTSSSLTQMEIGAALDITPNKAGALVRQLQAEGLVSVAEVKIPKVGNRKVYTIVSE